MSVLPSGAILVSLLLLPLTSAEAATITFDWSTEPEASDFDDVSSASTTVDGLTLSAAMLNGGHQFNISSAFGGSQSLGARGIGSQDNFDGEAGFTFNFDYPGTLTSIILVLDEFGSNYTLHTPNNGSHNYVGPPSADFSNESFTFLAGQNFTFQHNAGSYRVGSIQVEATVPEPSTLVLAAFGILSLAVAARSRRGRARASGGRSKEKYRHIRDSNSLTSCLRQSGSEIRIDPEVPRIGSRAYLHVEGR
ncbi:MAG: PEP-CTERM sorting domain-containing protein [Pirellulales bacterium]